MQQPRDVAPSTRPLTAMQQADVAPSMPMEHRTFDDAFDGDKAMRRHSFDTTATTTTVTVAPSTQQQRRL